MIDIDQMLRDVIETQQTSFAFFATQRGLVKMDFAPKGNTDKQRKLFILRQMAKMLDVSESVITCEVWVVIADADTPRESLPKNLSQHPDRVELFFYMREVKSLNGETHFFKIKRDRRGKIVELIPYGEKIIAVDNNLWILNNPALAPIH